MPTMTTIRPRDLDEAERIALAGLADVLEVERDCAATRAHYQLVLGMIRVHRSANALPSDALIEDLVRGRAATVYARHRSERDVVALLRLRRLLAPTWWERIGDWFRS